MVTVAGLLGVVVTAAAWSTQSYRLLNRATSGEA